MTPAPRAAVWLALAVSLLVCGCKLDVQTRPRTQMVVDIDADAYVQARANTVTLNVVGGAERSKLPFIEDGADHVVMLDGPDAPVWPLRQVLEPLHDDADRSFLLTATAKDADGRFLAQVRVLTGYVRGEVHRVSLRLTEACVHVMCDTPATCFEGHCRTGEHDANEFPVFVGQGVSVAHTVDAGLDASPIAAIDKDAAVDAGDAAGPTSLDGATPAVMTALADPCRVKNGGCDALTHCGVADGKVVCGVCPSGYDDVHGDGTLCRDIDECKRGDAGCDAQHGTCANTPGSFECRCLQGYHGNGKLCSTNVPCETDAACDDHASCTEVATHKVCVCARGFDGDGSSCRDVDECARKLAMCRANSVCLNSKGSFSCPCVKGYTESADACVDVDECAMGLSDCDDKPDACVNDEGGFHCACPVGYLGDGRGADGCIYNNECALGTDDCDNSPRACVDDLDGYHCVCPSGYRGNGRGADGCMDIDECAQGGANCDDIPNACVNTIGSYECMCPPGYRGDGRGRLGCMDINECEAGTDDCDHDPAACHNTDGGYRCACPSGYQGAGHGENGCSDIDECAARADNCDHEPNACHNTTGAFTCQCPSGYTGDAVGPNGCMDVDECAAGTDDCDTDPDACHNTAGAYQCSCPSGYEGDGRGANGCQDIDECMHDNGGCHPMRECKNTVGSSECGACAAGWGVRGAKDCAQCTCYQTGGAQACRSSSESLPAVATGMFPGSTTIPPGTLVGYQFDLPDAAHVSRFVARRSGGGSAGIRMALYSDAGNLPSKRLAYTNKAVLSDSVLQTPAVLETDACLAGGKYWLIVVGDAMIELGQAGDSVQTVLLSAPGEMELPTSWPGGGGKSGSTLSLYVQVDHP